MAEGRLIPCLVIMIGLPGTGKSSIARALALETGDVVFDKHRLRAALFPEPWIDYSQQQNELLCRGTFASRWLSAHRALRAALHFIDGRVFAFRYQVERVLNWGVGAGCRIEIIHTICSDETAPERLKAGHHPASNRNYDLYLNLKARFESIEHVKLTLDTERSLERSVTRCLSYLRTD
jgi:predicted kinase